MAIVYFGKTVKYKGTTYLPNTKFEADDKDIDGLKLQGAWIVEMPKEEGDKVELDELVEDESSQEEEEESLKKEKREIDILRDRALELGIDFKGNWGVKKLKEEIAKAE